MKKILDFILILFIFFILYFLQSNFFTWFNIAGIMPNLFVILIAIIGFSMKENLGFLFGTALGLILDFTIGPKVGVYAISLGTIRIYGRKVR